MFYIFGQREIENKLRNKINSIPSTCVTRYNGAQFIKHKLTCKDNFFPVSTNLF